MPAGPICEQPRQPNLRLNKFEKQCLSGHAFLEQYIPSHLFTFRILYHFYTYQNYSLTHAYSKVYLLSHNLLPVDINFNAPNCQEIADLFLTSSLGFKDISSIMHTINKPNLIHKCLNSLLLD